VKARLALATAITLTSSIARAEEEPRPPLPEVDPPPPPRWDRSIEVGGDAAFVIRPFANGVVAGPVRYEAAIGWGVHLHWELLDWLRLHPYFIDAHHDLAIPTGALATTSPNSVSRASTVAESTATSFVFGAKLAPTLELSRYARGWLSAGVGWGRFSFPTMTITEPSGAVFDVGERAGVFVEFPLGVGLSYEVWPDWLTIEYEATAAPIVGQSGTAHEPAQAVDAAGQLRDVGPIGAIEASFVQTLGLSLLL